MLVVDFNGSHTDFYIPYAKWMTDLRSKSSSIQIFGYKDLEYMATYYDDWAEVNTHEDWFVHDDVGNRIVNHDWGTYLMDVGNSEWRLHWLSYVNNKLGSCPAYNGVFADDVDDALNMALFDYAPNTAIFNRWHSDVLSMLEFVKANLLPEKQLIINTGAGWAPGQTDSDYLSVVDGMLIEGYFHAPWEDSNSYSKILESQISCLASGSYEGKIMIAESGSTSEDSRLLKWTYATFLLGVNGPDVYWAWAVDSSVTFNPDFLSITQTNIGSPIGAYYQSQNVYMRDFTGGKVLSNPSADPQTIYLGGGFWLLNNTEIFTLRLEGYSGEILLNAPVPTPTPTPTPTLSPSPDPTPTVTVSPTFYPSYSPSLTPSPSSSPSFSPTPSSSPSLTPSPSSSPSFSPTPSSSPSLTPSPSQEPTSTPENNTSVQTSISYAIVGGAAIVVAFMLIARKDCRQFMANILSSLVRKLSSLVKKLSSLKRKNS